MYAELSRAITEIVRFTNEHRIEAEFRIHTLGDRQGVSGVPSEYWTRFEKRAGGYVTLTAKVALSTTSMSPALESYLINKLRPALNKRGTTQQRQRRMRT